MSKMPTKEEMRQSFYLGSKSKAYLEALRKLYLGLGCGKMSAQAHDPPRRGGQGLSALGTKFGAVRELGAAIGTKSHGSSS